MRKTLFIAAMAILLMVGVSFAVDPSPVQETMKQEKSKSDGRTELKLPAHFKVMQQAMMRQHMDTVSDIIAALGSNDLNKAADLAQSGLSRSEAEKERCSMVEKITGDKNFVQIGKEMQRKADELADAARGGSRDKAFTALAELFTTCNDCHKRFLVTASSSVLQETVTINCNTCHKGFRR
jgi:hypothetical protein